MALALRWPGLHQALYGGELFTHDIVTRAGLGDLLGQIRDTSISAPHAYADRLARLLAGNPFVPLRTLPGSIWLAAAAARSSLLLLGTTSE